MRDQSTDLLHCGWTSYHGTTCHSITISQEKNVLINDSIDLTANLVHSHTTGLVYLMVHRSDNIKIFSSVCTYKNTGPVINMVYSSSDLFFSWGVVKH